MQEKSILIIDDDKDLSFIISDMLESYHYKVTIAASSEEAFDVLTNHTYDLILLDINFPDTTGFEICKRIKTRVNCSSNICECQNKRTRPYNRL